MVNYFRLWNDLPNLCADRLDYNIQGAYYQNFLTHEEVLTLFNKLQFKEGHWICEDHVLLKKLVRFSLFMTQDCLGKPQSITCCRLGWLKLLCEA